MIPEKKKMDVRSNVQGEKIAMGIDQDALVHIMNIMTDLYSDPEAAIIREYPTNALDAQIEAGVSRPIEVTTPSQLSPFLRVKDFGVGLDAEDIAEVYSQYGTSTKRGTNTQVGMLGLGCKSALTYTNQFTVVGVKDGTRTSVSISRDEDGAGSMTIVESVPTSEPNGVEVVIPVRRNNRIADKAAEFFRYWEPGTVLINGEPPTPLDGLKITPDGSIMVVQTETAYGRPSTHVVVMGNVPYPFDGDGLSLPGRSGIVARVPVGAVDFAPSREALQYTAKTKAAIAQLKADFKAAVTAAAQRNIEAAPDKAAALDEAVKACARLPVPRGTAFSYRGTPLPAEWTGEGINTANDTYDLGRSYPTKTLQRISWPRTVWVTGFALSKFTANHKKKLQKWAAGAGFGRTADRTSTIDTFLLAEPGPEVLPWIDPKRIVGWDAISAIKIPINSTRDPNGKPRIPGSYDMYVAGDSKTGVPADDIDTTKAVFWCAKHDAFRYGAWLNKHFPGCYVVSLGDNRIDKFRRFFPKARRASEGAKEVYDKWEKNLTGDQKLKLAITDAHEQAFERIDPKRVNDPAIAAAAKAARTDIKGILEDRRIFESVLRVGRLRREFDSPLDTYPLASSNQIVYHPEHFYFYVNALYRARQNGDPCPS